jgi:hypothetical protein
MTEEQTLILTEEQKRRNNEEHMASKNSTNDVLTLMIKSLLLFNGGAILSLLTFLGNTIGYICVETNVSSKLEYSFIFFSIGVIAALSSIFALYYNHMAMHEMFDTVMVKGKVPTKTKNRRTQVSFLILTGTSLVMFWIGDVGRDVYRGIFTLYLKSI